MELVNKYLNVLSVFLILTLAGCNTIPKLARNNPHIRGEVSFVNSQPDGTISGFRVEGKKEADTTYDIADVAVTPNTKFFTRDGDKYKIFPSGELKVGYVVEILFTGPRQTSAPVQGIAEEVIVIK